MNEPFTSIKIRTDKPTDLMVGNDLYIIENRYKINVKRSNDTLSIIVKQDTLTKTYYLKPKNSINYYGNIVTYGIGFIWDSKSEKRYTYQKNLYLDCNSQNLARFKPNEKGKIDLNLSLPFINMVFLKPLGEPDKIGIGSMGLKGGIEYLYKDEKSIGLNISAVFWFATFNGLFW